MHLVNCLKLGQDIDNVDLSGFNNTKMACSVFLKAVPKLKNMLTNVENIGKEGTSDKERGRPVPNKMSVVK